jgi:hypothetical protein
VRPGDEQLSPGADSSGLLIERERDVFRIREEIARSTDAQATGITAASLAVAAVAAGGEVLEDATLAPMLAAGVLLLLSAVAGGIARLPAPPPLKALLSKRERRRVLDLYANGSQPPGAAATFMRLLELGRGLGREIRDLEHTFGAMSPGSAPEVVRTQLLLHWRTRNRLARYRMHSKSAWLTVSLVLLYGALLLATASLA